MLSASNLSNCYSPRKYMLMKTLVTPILIKRHGQRVTTVLPCFCIST